MVHAPTILQQFLRYSGAGAIGTGCHYAVLILLVMVAGAGAVVASTIGAVIGAIVNYVLNYRYTFSSSREHALTLPRFGAIAIAGIALNWLVLAALTEHFGVHYLVAQVAATGSVLVTGYVANRAWTF